MKTLTLPAFNFATPYLGLDLPHPFMAGASPLTATVDGARRLEEAGSAALVLPSLFEEQAGSVAHAAYVDHVAAVRRATTIPVVASLNGTRAAEWLRSARDVARAGADAVELNFYHVAADPRDTSEAIERRLVDTVAVVKESIRIPVAVKLSPFFTSLPNLAQHLERIGADAIVVFNRYYQADIDPDLRAFVPGIRLSDSSELLPRLHAAGILSACSTLPVAVSGGVHEATDAVKAVLAGARVVQVTSALLRHGPEHLARLRRRVSRWATDHGYTDIAQLRGAARIADADGIGAAERQHYMEGLQLWDGPRDRDGRLLKGVRGGLEER